MLKIICPDENLRPTFGTEGSAGLDLKLVQDIQIPVGLAVKVGTGVKVEIPKGHMGLVVPRSSTGKKGLELINTVGVIDSDYQGEIILNIRNVSRETYLGYKYDALFQLIIVPIMTDTIVFVEKFNTTTDRGDGGFGSTDKEK